MKSDYANKLPTLKEFVARYARGQVNTFYIAKARNDDGQEYLYAYWKEDQSILLLEHFRYFGKATDFGWLHRKARIDLKTDVVPTQADIGASTFLVDRAWVNGIIRACTTKGRRIVLLKSKHLPGQVRRETGKDGRQARR